VILHEVGMLAHRAGFGGLPNPRLPSQLELGFL
jgi:hypothetical protein